MKGHSQGCTVLCKGVFGGRPYQVTLHGALQGSLQDPSRLSKRANTSFVRVVASPYCSRRPGLECAPKLSCRLTLGQGLLDKEMSLAKSLSRAISSYGPLQGTVPQGPCRRGLFKGDVVTGTLSRDAPQPSCRGMSRVLVAEPCPGSSPRDLARGTLPEGTCHGGLATGPRHGNLFTRTVSLVARTLPQMWPRPVLGLFEPPRGTCCDAYHMGSWD